MSPTSPTPPPLQLLNDAPQVSPPPSTPDLSLQSPRLDWSESSPSAQSDTDFLPAAYPRPNFYSAGSSSTIISSFSTDSLNKSAVWSESSKRPWSSILKPATGSSTQERYITDPKRLEDDDDKLHSFDDDDVPSFTIFSARGWLNIGALAVLAMGMIGLFAGYPVIAYVNSRPWEKHMGWNLGGVNGTGQVPDIPNLPTLIDVATPSEAKERQGFDGKKYNLVFSDEFNTDNRTFWPGDDPYWEAVDLHYWNTADFEWYDPDAIVTRGGNLVITVVDQKTRGLDYRSGMLQSWNKFCFTGGYIEVSISLPGTHTVPGFWPGVWTIGNLGRAGYGATTDGVWPYSYDSCDVGTLKNQTNVDGLTPTAAITSGGGPGGELSYQPGQRVSACTCKGEDHPGPSVNVGRGAPEIDVLEAAISAGGVGGVSQSAQFAPYDDGYAWLNTTAGATLHNAANTHLNSYRGGVYQQAASAVTHTDPNAYDGGAKGFQKFGFEYKPGTDGHITWNVGDDSTWTLNAAAVGPNTNVGIGQRLISQEPMSIVLNLAISASFQRVDLENLQFPSQFLIDYVRVYQADGEENIGCDPKGYPTAKYIEDHREAYTNANLTTWSQAGYQNPRNSIQDGC